MAEEITALMPAQTPLMIRCAVSEAGDKGTDCCDSTATTASTIPTGPIRIGIIKPRAIRSGPSTAVLPPQQPRPPSPALGWPWQIQRSTRRCESPDQSMCLGNHLR